MVTLYGVSMATAVIVRNTGSKPVELTGAVLSHIKFDKRGGTAVEGLRGCPYCSQPPPAAGFSLLSPAEAMMREDPGWFSGGGEEPRQGVWTVEEDLYTVLKKKVSRVYAAPPEERKKRVYSTAPSKFTTIDQVRSSARSFSGPHHHQQFNMQIIFLSRDTESKRLRRHDESAV